MVFGYPAPSLSPCNYWYHQIKFITSHLLISQYVCRIPPPGTRASPVSGKISAQATHASPGDTDLSLFSFTSGGATPIGEWLDN
jgi:hypothetical protein